MSSLSTVPSPPAFDWHPKLTPYRLTFIAISGGLGVAKAILVSRGQVVASTTVEWVTGVVVALSFQFLSEYEYKNRRSAFLDWMFSHDCLNDLKIFIHACRPNGENRPMPTQSAPQANTLFTPTSPPIVTLYRMLVSTTISVFGIAKIFCGYFGLSTAMNTFDWVIAIPLTLGLYYVGLYEERRSRSPRILFDVEYSSKARLWLYFAGVASLCLCWLCAWSIIFHEAITLFNGTASDTQSIWEARLERAVQWMGISFCLGMLAIGAWGLRIVLWPIIEACSGRHVNSIRKHIDHVASLILYLLLAIFFMALSLVGAFAGGEILNTGKNSLPQPFRIIFLGMLFCSTSVPAGFAYGFITQAVKVYSESTSKF